MRHAIGDRLQHFEIIAHLGTGGMGEVYKARDARLNRVVAIKILSEKFSDRFEREARAISALNHPHICTLHDVGPGYLVMELVEGETLAERLQKGRLPMDVVLRHGAEMADALAAAHAKGIIHRDLKPGNLMVTKSGIKVLDFGLAKMTQSDETLTVSKVIQGTPAYMSPEQLEGKACDPRTDIFALGLVLYEMATGKRKGQGEVANLGELSERFAHVVERCLEPDPENRWQSARDVRAELEWAAKNQISRPQPASGSRARLAALLFSGLVAAGLAGVGVWWLTPHAAPVTQSVARFTVELPSGDNLPIDTGLPISIALTPSGEQLLYVGQRSGVHQIFARRRDELAAVPVAGTEGAVMPFVSPTGEWIGFVSGGQLKKVPITGGPPISLAEAPVPSGATWGTDGRIVFSPTWSSGLLIVSEQGGSARPLTTLDTANGEEAHREPSFLPGNRSLLFVVRLNDGRHQIQCLDLASGRRRTLTEGRTPLYATTGHLIFSREATLFAAPFDLGTLELHGMPLPVLDGVTTDGAKSHVALAADGTLAYVPAAAHDRRLVWVDMQGRVRAASADLRSFWHPRLSPDGKRIVVHVGGEQGGIWVYERDRGTRMRLNTSGTRPIWTPDGTGITFQWQRSLCSQGRWGR